MNIYTDGSCVGNPGPGGWCWVDLENNTYASGFESHTTNSRMEIVAVLEAMNHIGERSATIYSDSEYVVKGVNLWMENWKRKNWPNKNSDLWKKISDLYNPDRIIIKWVKAHVGISGNESANRLAYQAAKTQQSNQGYL